MFGVVICTWVRNYVHNFPRYQQALKPVMYKKPRALRVLCSECDDGVRARLCHDDF
jgi:hypothetical protein